MPAQREGLGWPGAGVRNPTGEEAAVSRQGGGDGERGYGRFGLTLGAGGLAYGRRCPRSGQPARPEAVGAVWRTVVEGAGARDLGLAETRDAVAPAPACVRDGGDDGQAGAWRRS